jgi:N-acyl-L-homoserine lactone synthetase
MSTVDGRTGQFALRVSSLLDTLEFDRVETEEQREAVYRLRYDCYLAEAAIEPREQRRFTDRFDEQSNGFLFAIRHRERLISSIRIHIATPEYPHTPSTTAFSDVLGALTGRGETFVDPTRFVVDRRVRAATALMPYATLRLAAMAADHFDTDHIIATARLEHTPFYRRIFQLEPRTPPRDYLGLVKPLCLMSNDTETIREKVYTRYPIFSSDPEERAALFGPSRSTDFLNRHAARANDNDGRSFRRYPMPVGQAGQDRSTAKFRLDDI